MSFLKGKTAIITGAAVGIGRAAAIKLASAGALYNVDPATAGASINYKLKEKFVSFKTPDLKALVSKQKQPYVQNREMDDGGTLLNESNVPQCLVMYFAMLKAYSMYLF